MQNSQLIGVLKALTPEETREFKKWVHSPAHNSRDDVMRMIDYLLSTYTLEHDAKLSKDKVFRQAYPKEPAFDGAKLRQTVYFAMRALEDYLIYKELQEDETYVDLLLLRTYRKRGLGKLFERGAKSMKKNFEKTSQQDISHWRHQFLMRDEEFSYYGDKKRGANEFDLQEYSDVLDISFLAQKMRQLCNIYTKLNVYKTEEDVSPLINVTEYIEKNNLTDQVPAIGVYYYGFKSLINSTNEDYFHKLKDKITSYASSFDLLEAEGVYRLAINYCIRQINSGQPKYIEEVFALYRQGLEQGMFIANSDAFTWTFGNIITTSLRLKNYEWTQGFIERYQRFLPEEHRESLVAFNTAKLYFEQGDYKTAMPYLIQLDHHDVLLTLSSKSLLLKMYYEEGEEDALQSLLDSMSAYMNRKKVIGYHKNNHKNIIRLTKKLLKLNPYESRQVKKLYQDIIEADPLRERKWLLTQLQKAAPSAYAQVEKEKQK